ncbi:MAG: DUF115 domain-containing protein [Spirochaetaceae bacterium]|jgi:hypothetical protein|nr:DUF115 domain-containing protein [Spirochaetaceae bacterium]
MKETLLHAQCGLNTAAAGQRNIHSRYNPLIEAERYIDSLNLHGGIEYIILAECGLCYVIEPLRKKFPNAKIISLHLSTFYAGKNVYTPDAEWLPDSPINKNTFLENEIDDVEADKIKIIEWRPAAGIYGVEYLNLIKDISAFVKRIDANKRTRTAFGRRWFKNIIKNCFLFNGSCVITRITRNSAGGCVVAGAGPGLEDAYAAIRHLTKHGSLLIAVSSAVSALFQAGLRPDIIVACDGGNWALMHLFESVRYFYLQKHSQKTPCPVLAYNLSAAVPSQFSSFNLLPLSDESLLQNIALKCFDIPQISFPQRGTVGVSALDLALYMSSGAVYTAGINFSHKDIRTHAKPYAFDRILSLSADRFIPLYTLQFERAEMITKSGVNGVYADWLSRQDYKREIYAITDNNYAFNNEMRNTKADIFEYIKKNPVLHPVERFITTILAALENPLTKDKLTVELSNLLLNNVSNVSNKYDTVREELLRVSEKYRIIERRYG